MNLYNITCYKISKLVTKTYSTSFFSASILFHKSIKKHIFNIYGFVRFADEIVDTFHNFNKKSLIENFETEFYNSTKNNISLNPIIHAFQITVKEFNIPNDYINAFLSSMKSDINKKNYTNKSETDTYIYGSADVVGLMCLKVFCKNNDNLFQELEKYALKLGSAFQKVNFLRDIKNDTEILNRKYFHQLNSNIFNDEVKNIIIEDIESDFLNAKIGIKKLPENSKLAVYVAYRYYLSLLRKIKKLPAEKIISNRIRISNTRKFIIVISSFLEYKLKLI